MYQNNDFDLPSGGRQRWIARWAGTIVKLEVTRLAIALILLLLTAPLATGAAQSPEKVPRVGYIFAGLLF